MKFVRVFIAQGLILAVLAQDIVIPSFVPRTNPDFPAQAITTEASLEGTVVVVSSSAGEIVTLSVSDRPYTAPPSTAASSTPDPSTSDPSTPNPLTPIPSTQIPSTSFSSAPVSSSPVSSTAYTTYTITSTVTSKYQEPVSTGYAGTFVTETLPDGYIDLTTTVQIPASTSTYPTNTLLSTVQSVVPEHTITHLTEETQVGSTVETFTSQIVNSHVVETKFGSKLFEATDFVKTSSAVVETATTTLYGTLYSTLTRVSTFSTVTVPITVTTSSAVEPPISALTYTVYVEHNTAVQEKTYQLPSTAYYYSYFVATSTSTNVIKPTETVVTSVPTFEKTTLTQEYYTTILSQPFSTQTIKPTVYYANATNVETIVIYESCSIVSKTFTTWETEIMTQEATTLYPSSTYTLLDPIGSWIYAPIVCGGTTTVTIGCSTNSCQDYLTYNTVSLPTTYDATTYTTSSVNLLITTLVDVVETVTPKTSSQILNTEWVPSTVTKVSSWYENVPTDTIYATELSVSTWYNTHVETSVSYISSEEVISAITNEQAVAYETQYTEEVFDGYQTESVYQSSLYKTTTYSTDVPITTIYEERTTTKAVTETLTAANDIELFANIASPMKSQIASKSILTACIVLVFSLLL